MKIENLISPTNENLFNLINTKYNVKLNKIKDISWTSFIIGKTAHIGYINCSNPEAAFTHELLHFKLQINGFTKLTYGAFPIKDEYDFFPTFLEALDNELQHHKIYNEFLKMGYAEKSFYCDDDCNTSEYIKNYLSSSNQSILKLLTNYLTVISPGSNLIFDNIDNTKKLFRSKKNLIYERVMDTIDNEIEDWSTSSTCNPKNTIINIFKCIPNASGTFIGTGEKDDYPRSGFKIL